MKEEIIRLIKRYAVRIGYCSKPDFLIIGAQKSGTTALFSTLKQHSRLTGALAKEIHYFDNDEWYLKNRISDYHTFFPLPYQVPKNNLLFEATPIYLYHPEIAERLYKYNPDLKLIIMLRNPAYRALSAWTMYHHHFKEGENKNLYDNREFHEAIEAEIKNIESVGFYNDKKAYVKRGIYYYQIEEYLKYFQKDKLLILESDEFKNQFEKNLAGITSFLDISFEKLKAVKNNESRTDNKSLYEPEINMLKEFYRPYNQKLFELLGRKYDWD